jgi:hypothetical protein
MRGIPFAPRNTHPAKLFSSHFEASTLMAAKSILRTFEVNHFALLTLVDSVYRIIIIR